MWWLVLWLLMIYYRSWYFICSFLVGTSRIGAKTAHFAPNMEIGKRIVIFRYGAINACFIFRLRLLMILNSHEPARTTTVPIRCPNHRLLHFRMHAGSAGGGITWDNRYAILGGQQKRCQPLNAQRLWRQGWNCPSGQVKVSVLAAIEVSNMMILNQILTSVPVQVAAGMRKCIIGVPR